MISCCCSLAGTKACETCSNYPMVWKQIGYRLPKDLNEKLHTPEPHKDETMGDLISRQAWVMCNEKIVKYIEESLSAIYCNSCKNSGNLDICNYCHRKSMMWGISHKKAESIADGIVKILEGEYALMSIRKELMKNG